MIWAVSDDEVAVKCRSFICEMGILDVPDSSTSS